MLGPVMGLWKQQGDAGSTSLREQHRCLAEPSLPPAGVSPTSRIRDLQGGLLRLGCCGFSVSHVLIAPKSRGHSLSRWMQLTQDRIFSSLWGLQPQQSHHEHPSGRAGVSLSLGVPGVSWGVRVGFGGIPARAAPLLPRRLPLPLPGGWSQPLPRWGLFCKQRDRMRRKCARNGSMSPLGRTGVYL